MRYLTLFTVLFTLSSPHAYAAPEISDEGAQKAKVVAEQYLALYAPFFAVSPDSQVSKNGEIQVEKASDYYAITLPELKVTNLGGKTKDGQDEAIIFNLGITSMNVAPTKDPLEWKVAVAMPTPFLVTDKDNKVIFEMHINNQKMGGIWNTELEAMARMKAEYKNIKINFVKGDAKVEAGSIGRVYIESNAKKISDDNWESPARITMDNFAFGAVNEPDRASLRIKNITADGSVSGYAPTKIKKLYEIMNQMSSDRNNQELPKGYFDILRQAMSSWNSDFEMTGLVINNKAKNGVNQKPIKLDKAGFKLDFSSDDNGLASNTIGLSYSGLEMDTQGQPSKEAIATSFGFQIALENLPMDKLMQFGEQASGAMEGPGDNKQKMQGAAMMAMMALPQTLAEAGTTLRIEEMNMANKHYTMGGKGYIKATTESAIGALGEANFKYAGIDKLIQFMSDAMAGMDNERKKAREKSWVSRLEFLNQIGQPDPANADVRTINFKLTPQGQTLINGRPFQEVLAGPAAAQQAQ